MPQLCLITALPAETRPLLDALKLRQHKTTHLRVFTSDNLFLLETGVGKLNAAACTAAMLQQHPDIKALLNIGIAGGCYNYGQTLLAHRVLDKASGMQWYPHLPGFKAFESMPSSTIVTVDQPVTDYKTGIMFDMEAAGVYSAAARYLSTSAIHCAKVISDNPENSLQAINRQSVSSLITSALSNIKALIAGLLASIDAEQHQFNDKVNTCVDNICSRIHHSTNDKHQLHRIVQRYLAITGSLPQPDDTSTTARKLRHSLQTALNLTPIDYT